MKNVNLVNLLCEFLERRGAENNITKHHNTLFTIASTFCMPILTKRGVTYVQLLLWPFGH